MLKIRDKAAVATDDGLPEKQAIEDRREKMAAGP
jgi:hypothetical protein